MKEIMVMWFETKLTLLWNIKIEYSRQYLCEIEQQFTDISHKIINHSAAVLNSTYEIAKSLDI